MFGETPAPVAIRSWRNRPCGGAFEKCQFCSHILEARWDWIGAKLTGLAWAAGGLGLAAALWCAGEEPWGLCCDPSLHGLHVWLWRAAAQSLRESGCTGCVGQGGVCSLWRLDSSGLGNLGAALLGADCHHLCVRPTIMVCDYMTKAFCHIVTPA